MFSSFLLSVFLGLIGSRNFMQAKFSGVSSVKPISCISAFRLGFEGDVCCFGGESMLIFIGFSFLGSSIVLIETGSPKAFANVD